MKRTLRVAAVGLTLVASLFVRPPCAQAQAPVPSRVEASWNRFYDYQAMTDLLRALVDAYPELLELESIGQSVEGREMWLVTMNNPETGPDDQKPAMWIDANVHGNEVQGTEAVLYSIWYMTRSYGVVEPLTELMDRAAFYFCPTVNPDSRDHWFNEPNTASTQRSGGRPTDNDYDGLLDEDGPEDLDGDGNIGRMYRIDPNGRMKRDTRDPRLFVPIEPGEDVEERWSSVGSEGIDNDGDGRINEDGRGGYDMNRNWPSGWQPNYVQFGAGDYPLSYPETRSVGQFINAHPNIAAGQSYHNAGGMILRGPGQPYRESFYPRADRAVYDRLGEAGEELLPFYRYMILHADLYPVHGGFVTWLSEGLGIVSFTNEQWSNRRIMQNDERRLDQRTRLRWIDRMQFGQTVTDFTEYDHPTLGRVLIGGTSKYFGRVPPTFMIEEESHRNFAFTMFHADSMPLLSFDWTEVKRLDGDLWQITVEVENEKIIPTRLQLAADKGIGRPDVLSLSGDGVRVVASGTLDDRFDLTLDPVEHRRAEIPNDRGIPGEARRTFRYLVTGPEGARLTLSYSAEKARDIEMTVDLK
ncbi:MAG: M14 family metallopeptidase [Planctomycetota bacterium]